MILNFASFFDFIIIAGFLSILYNYEYYDLLYNNTSISWIYLVLPFSFYFIRLLSIYNLYPRNLPSVLKSLLQLISHVSLLGIIPSLLMMSRLYSIEMKQLDEISLRWGFKLRRIWTENDLFNAAVSYCNEKNYSLICTDAMKKIVAKSTCLQDLTTNLDGLYVLLVTIENSNETKSNHIPTFFDSFSSFSSNIWLFLKSHQSISITVGIVSLILINKYDIFKLNTAFNYLKSNVLNINDHQTTINNNVSNITKRLDDTVQGLAEQVNPIIQSQKHYGTEIALNTRNMEKLEEYFNHNTNAFNSKLEHLRTDANDIMSDLDEVSENVNNISNTVDNLENKVDALTESNNLLREQVLQSFEMSETSDRSIESLHEIIKNNPLIKEEDALPKLLAFLSKFSDVSEILDFVDQNMAESSTSNIPSSSQDIPAPHTGFQMFRPSSILNHIPFAGIGRTLGHLSDSDTTESTNFTGDNHSDG